ncbi:nedd8-activating enzyme e1 regulatory subunit [Trichoderma arundinaceum]|uniref:Nedd8-activating enzyme e1 regulatory subunit n=1 Tax=Trichoderma arundinaceum TaxID=490622 RepID=A0A395NDY4_TRIAR|nr:nedd8-activating enzyme e1 regulatory subunit [Trichoderma arundinaceum]
MTEILAQTPPILHGPSDKERKYDRQLRLWAASGQAALESANMLLINSGPGTVGIETLKNLVLPGIGKFTIADSAVVQDVDLGVNFFLDEASLGKSRAQCCTELLLELNPEVDGVWNSSVTDPASLRELLEAPEVFTMIMYSLPLEPGMLQVIEEYGRRHRAPLVAIHSVGFYSYFRITLPGTFPIVDTHPDDTATTDLRLLAPWPELSEFANEMTKDIHNLDHHDHGHLPMVVILLYYLDIWKYEHGGAYPTSYSEKTAFRQLVSDATRRDNPEGGEENFDEAVAAVMKHVVLPPIPSALTQVFEYEHKDEQQSKSSFWIIAEALKGFYTEHQRLPVAGGLPDMKAQSNIYIKLQNIYKEKARKDANEVLNRAHKIPGGEDIDLEEVELFCTNARFIKLINTTGDGPQSMEQIIERELSNDEIAAIAGPEMPTSLIPIYLALICQKAPALKGNERLTQIAQELSRAAGGELHNISAVTGGQENQRCTMCPVCNAQLPKAEDVALTNLTPTEEYKTCLLSGLSPNVIMECAGRAISFWAYQTTQNLYYQQYLYKTLSEKYAALWVRLDQANMDATAEVNSLCMTASRDVLQRKNDELAEAFKDKSRKLFQTQELYNKIKRKAELGQIERAAFDAVDSSIRSVPHLAVNNQESNAFLSRHSHDNNERNLPPSHGMRFDTTRFTAAPSGPNLQQRENESNWPRKRTQLHEFAPEAQPYRQAANDRLSADILRPNITSNAGLARGDGLRRSGTNSPAFLQRRNGWAGVGLTSGLKVGQPIGHSELDGPLRSL